MADFSKARTPLDVLDVMAGPARAFAAGVAAADADNARRQAAAYKLRRLIERAEKVRNLLEKGWHIEAHSELCAALGEALGPPGTPP